MPPALNACTEPNAMEALIPADSTLTVTDAKAVSLLSFRTARKVNTYVPIGRVYAETLKTYGNVDEDTTLTGDDPEEGNNVHRYVIPEEVEMPAHEVYDAEACTCTS